MSEWKSGDVAMVRIRGVGDEQFVMRASSGGGEWWIGLGSDESCHWRVDSSDAARRLVVIDPEDREHVERLYRLYYGCTPEYQPVPSLLNQLQAALREFAQPRPVKPEEPLGLGAVVEDERGIRWVRWEGMFALPWCAPNEPSCKYSEITAVRVLSEGVTE